jgi:outer membrane protein assembly factor BamD
MMKKAIFLLVVLLVILSGCSRQFNKVLKSKDYNFKLKVADQYYAKKDYRRAEELYVDLFPALKGTDKFEDVYYKYAYCAFYQKNYEDAENLFKGFLEVFPNSEKSEEVAYMNAYCFYKQSPKPELDQANTTKAIGMMQTFIATHPSSKRIKDANNVIDACRKKLELKDYKAAQLYYDLEQYRAAGITFTNLINSYPDSPKGEQYMLMIVKSYYEFALNSIPNKQEERYQKVSTEYYDFADRYPDSKLLKEAEHYKNISVNNIKKLENEQTKTSAER